VRTVLTLFKQADAAIPSLSSDRGSSNTVIASAIRPGQRQYVSFSVAPRISGAPLRQKKALRKKSPATLATTP
jgi:hypothetical protein